MEHSPKEEKRIPSRRMTADEARKLLDAAFYSGLTGTQGPDRPLQESDQQGRLPIKTMLDMLTDDDLDALGAKTGEFVRYLDLNTRFGVNLFSGSGATNGNSDNLSYAVDAGKLRSLAMGINPAGGISRSPTNT